MKFTEHPFRTFTTIGFFAGLAKSNLVYTFLKSVSSPILPPSHSTLRHLLSVLAPVRIHVPTSSNSHSPAQQWESHSV